MSIPTYTVYAEHSDGWWTLTAPGFGFVAQVRDIARAEEYAIDGIAWSLGTPESFDVEVKQV